MKSFPGQRQRILERLLQGGRVPMPELSRIGSGNPAGWCNSFTRRISEIRSELLPSGKDVVCHKTYCEGRTETAYEIVDVPLHLVEA